MIERSAEFSPCRRYRYVLWRNWGDLITPTKGYVMFIGLNPSTADETNDDPTVRRCIAYAKAWGYSALCMTNIFAFRATDPKDMMLAHLIDPVGPENDAWLLAMANDAALVVAAWGVHGSFQDRGGYVRRFLPKLHCLRLTKDGHPGHPLYLPKTLRPVEIGKETMV